MKLSYMALNKWKKYGKKIKGAHGRSTKGKTGAVLGMLQLDGEMRAMVVNNTSSDLIRPHLRNHIAADSKILSDDWYAYFNMPEYQHEFVDHSKGQYVAESGATTNAVESSWACLKGSLRINHNNVQESICKIC